MYSIDGHRGQDQVDEGVGHPAERARTFVNAELARLDWAAPVCQVSPRRIRASTASSSGRRSSGMMSVMGRPMASAAVKPYNSSAARFQDVMMSSSVLLTIASSESATMAASRAGAS